MSDHFFSSKDLTIYLLLSEVTVGQIVPISSSDPLPILVTTLTLPLPDPVKI